MTGCIMLNRKELRRVHVIEKVMSGELLIREAAHLLGLSERQVKRLKKGVKIQGHAFLAHKNRGRKPIHAVPKDVADQVVSLVTDPLKGASCEHISELLAEHHGIHLSPRTIRRILDGAGLVNPHSHKAPRRRRCRSRMPQEGLLGQCDASPYAWLEDRGPTLSLHGIIDDATNKILGLHFRLHEDLIGYLNVLRHMLDNHGVPHSLYCDGHSIFFPSKQDSLSIDDELAGKQAPLTQFGEILGQLGINHIRARSPQAKGRIERLWGTLQHRLMIELRLAAVSTIDQANAFLPSFIDRFNQRFAVTAAQPELAFRPSPPKHVLDSTVALREYRIACNDSTISYYRKTYQLIDPKGSPISLPNKARIAVLTHLDGSVSALFKGQSFAIREFVRPLPLQQTAIPRQPKSKAHKPAPNHPWRYHNGRRVANDPVQAYFDRHIDSHLSASTG